MKAELTTWVCSECNHRQQTLVITDELKCAKCAIVYTREQGEWMHPKIKEMYEDKKRKKK